MGNERSVVLTAMSLKIQSHFFSDSFTPEDEGTKTLRNGGEL
jgi:hypothetical protein